MIEDLNSSCSNGANICLHYCIYNSKNISSVEGLCTRHYSKPFL